MAVQHCTSQIFLQWSGMYPSLMQPFSIISKNITTNHI